MCDDKNKNSRNNSEDTPRERPRQDDSRRRTPPTPKNRGYIGESKEQQDNLRKAMEVPPKPTKPSKDNSDEK